VSVLRSPAFADDNVDACGVRDINRVLSRLIFCLNQVLISVFTEFGKRRVPMLEVV
jgi:hypothetical protein